MTWCGIVAGAYAGGLPGVAGRGGRSFPADRGVPEDCGRRRWGACAWAGGLEAGAGRATLVVVAEYRAVVRSRNVTLAFLLPRARGLTNTLGAAGGVQKGEGAGAGSGARWMGVKAGADRAGRNRVVPEGSLGS